MNKDTLCKEDYRGGFITIFSNLGGITCLGGTSQAMITLGGQRTLGEIEFILGAQKTLRKP